MSWKKTFYEGLKSGIPIGLGYLPVSFTFGFLAVSGGLPVWVAVFISLTNLTSAGQFAGTNLILAVVRRSTEARTHTRTANSA